MRLNTDDASGYGAVVYLIVWSRIVRVGWFKGLAYCFNDGKCSHTSELYIYRFLLHKDK